MIATRDLERVELERAEPIQHAQDRRRLGRQGARRGEQVAQDEEPPRGARAHGTGFGAHGTRW